MKVVLGYKPNTVAGIKRLSRNCKNKVNESENKTIPWLEKGKSRFLHPARCALC